MGNCQNLPDTLMKKGSPKSKGPSHVIVSTFTWPRDSHGLFDYESKTLAKKVFKAQSAGNIRRNGNDIGFIKENDKSVKQGDRDLIKLTIKDGNFWINPCGKQGINLENKDQSPTTPTTISDTLENDPWLVLKSFKANTNKGYKLNQGDLFKLGRVKFRIREMKGTYSPSANKDNAPEKQAVNTEIDNNGSMEESFRKSPKSEKGSRVSLNHACRICLSEACEADNPFFSPCNCAGTMKLIHVKCLQTWLKSKLHVKTSGNTTYIYWKNLECELCKTPYPQYFDVDNKRYDIVEIERPESAYIVLEVLSKEKNMTKGVHIIKMENKNNIRLGRGHDSDIRITDISVSRCHAVIKLEKGNFYIEDNNSKFGSLLHIDKPTPITGDYNNASLQIGRTVVTLTAKKGRGMFPICFSGTSNNLDTTTNEKNFGPGNGIFNVVSQEQNILNNVLELAPASDRPVINDEPNRERASRHNVQDNQIGEAVPVPVIRAFSHRVHMIQPNLGDDNEGNIGEEANERSYYSARN